MANAFNVDITALDNLTQATKDAVAQQMDEWIEKQSAAGDTLTQKLTALRLEYKKLRDEAIKAGLDTSELDKTFAKRRAEIITKSLEMNLKPIELDFKFNLNDLIEETTKAIKDATEKGDLKIGLGEKEKEQVINSAVSTAGQNFGE